MRTQGEDGRTRAGVRRTESPFKPQLEAALLTPGSSGVLASRTVRQSASVVYAAWRVVLCYGSPSPAAISKKHKCFKILTLSTEFT